MIVACGFDHAGYGLKETVLKVLREEGHEVIDLGTDSPDPVDYPDKALAVARELVSGDAECGVLVCGSGAGIAVAANKIRGIRAAAAMDTYTAHQSVEHDKVNILCLGERVTGSALAADILRTFITAKYTGEERHRRRLAKIDTIERDGIDSDLSGVKVEGK